MVLILWPPESWPLAGGIGNLTTIALFVARACSSDHMII